jgi:hypothetical protein
MAVAEMGVVDHVLSPRTGADWPSKSVLSLDLAPADDEGSRLRRRWRVSRKTSAKSSRSRLLTIAVKTPPSEVAGRRVWRGTGVSPVWPTVVPAVA